MSHLTRLQLLPTSGARAAESFRLGSLELLAIPQLSYDIPGTEPHMNGGDSETEVLLLRREGDSFEPWGSLKAPGGEDAEFFTIGDRSFLAVASIRTGAGRPYDFTVPSHIFEWNGTAFVPFQSVDGFAAKQWRHFVVDGKHFLALAQGVAVPGTEKDNRPSVILRWDGARFVHFQDIDSRWGYNWHFFALADTAFLAHADHTVSSVLHRWDGTRFVAHQELATSTGRAFATFDTDGDTYLVVACIGEGTRVLRWDPATGFFVHHQDLEGTGARELAVVRTTDGLYVIRVNFIQGTPDNPVSALMSQVYRWEHRRLTVVQEFPTSGGTDLAVLDSPDGPLVVQTNALAANLRFATHTVVYRFSG
ncbi:hypothetical protein ACGFY0_34300 [Streptomyces chartreusis]|uniref:hypothetical protein n=1 Tax=Streptomyces TaxID=1883 RepID=UPI00034E1236|nr:hypothetical protein [Streptomyces sp. HGB0020]EPD57770.1 hypothetical protein HMPREF1211_06108 [Streptomyces sp. HGB0020]